MFKDFYGEEFSDIKRLKPSNPEIQTLGDLYKILLQAWSEETAYPGTCWSEDCPSEGQCAVTAMLVYDLFGGSIHRIRWPEGGTHYFNRINGHYIDLTADQLRWCFDEDDYQNSEVMNRKYCGTSANTSKRYNLLKGRICEVLNIENPYKT